MSRRDTKPVRRDEPRRTGGKRGGLFLGLLLGLVIGLVAAAGLAWYFNLRTGEFKAVEQVPDIPPPVQPDRSIETVKAQPAPPATIPVPEPAESDVAPPTASRPPVTKPAAAPIVERKSSETSAPSARVPLTFYGILPGEKPAKPVEPPKPKEVWWLQVAALKNPADADRLKARLSLLGLGVSINKVDSAGQSLYRVRVGPYKRDEDAFADLDTLATNNYEPRLFKEPM